MMRRSLVGVMQFPLGQELTPDVPRSGYRRVARSKQALRTTDRHLPIPSKRREEDHPP